VVQHRCQRAADQRLDDELPDLAQREPAEYQRGPERAVPNPT